MLTSSKFTRTCLKIFSRLKWTLYNADRRSICRWTHSITDGLSRSRIAPEKCMYCTELKIQTFPANNSTFQPEPDQTSKTTAWKTSPPNPPVRAGRISGKRQKAVLSWRNSVGQMTSASHGYPQPPPEQVFTGNEPLIRFLTHLLRLRSRFLFYFILFFSATVWLPASVMPFSNIDETTLVCGGNTVLINKNTKPNQN